MVKMKATMTRDPERLLVTADLHFGLYPTGDAAALNLADFVCSSGADVFINAGDVADAEAERFGACLRLFEDFGGLKLVVPGNHDLWIDDVGSREKYRNVLPAIASECGFAMLDTGPITAGRTGFVGNIGWYDYGFRNPDLNVGLEQYERKELPGVCAWNDGRFIDWELSDCEFTEKCLRKLQDAYRSVESHVDTVVAVLHHLPFGQLMYAESGVAHEFCRAFMGSPRFGELLLDCPKVRYVFCGHRHGPERCSMGHIEAFAVGSDYFVKRLVELNLKTGEHTTHVFRPPGQAEAEQ